MKRAHCRDKGVGDDHCVQKKDCPICKVFTPEQVQQLATPKSEPGRKKSRRRFLPPYYVYPYLGGPYRSQTGRVGRGMSSYRRNPCWQEKKRPDETDESPKPSKKKSSSKPTSEDLKSLDNKRAQSHNSSQVVCSAGGTFPEACWSGDQWQVLLTPQALRAVGVLFSPSQLRAGRQSAGNSLSGLYLRNRKV